MITQHQQRESLVFLWYRFYIDQGDSDDLKKLFFDQFRNDQSYTEAFYQKYLPIFQCYREIEQKVSTKLNDKWTFQRLNNLHKAILIIAAYELTILKMPKQIVIREANNISDKYTPTNNFKFINGVLDQI